MTSPLFGEAGKLPADWSRSRIGSGYSDPYEIACDVDLGLDGPVAPQKPCLCMSWRPGVGQICNLKIVIIDPFRMQDVVTLWDKRKGKSAVVFGDGGMSNLRSIICVEEREFSSIQNVAVMRRQNTAA